MLRLVGLTRQQLKRSLDTVARGDRRFAKALRATGYPEPRRRPRGFATLLRTIVGQQVSVASANAIWAKLEAQLEGDCEAHRLAALSEENLRACGLSRQKQRYARSLAQHVLDGELDVLALPRDDEEAIECLTQVQGIGRWSAEVYLLFAEGRRDVWPAGDLAIQNGLAQLFRLDERPKEKQTRALAEAWSPHRGAMAIWTWHLINNAGL